MLKINISKRLLEIQKNIIGKDNIIIDVGCDHCYTGIHALLNKKAKHVFNIDKRINPLKNGIKNIEKYKLLNKTTNIVSDGLNTDAINKEIDYCVISGLGGKNITNILQKKDKKIKIKNYVILSNDNPQIIREYIKNNNYFVVNESVIKQSFNGKDYFFYLIVFNQKNGKKIRLKEDIEFGPINIKKKTKVFLEYITNSKNYYKKLYKKTKLEKYKKKIQLYSVIN